MEWKRSSRAAGLAAVAAAGLVTAAGPVMADTEQFRDARGDTGSMTDIGRVLVEHGGGVARLTVDVRVGKLDLGDQTTVWVNTRSRDSGPEYRLRVVPNSEVRPLRAVETWNDGGDAVRCAGLTARSNALGNERVRISIPRHCLDRPARVRIGVRHRFATPSDPERSDRAPARHGFFGWVHR